MSKCPKCSNVLTEDDRFCGECGTRIPAPESESNVSAEDVFGLNEDEFVSKETPEYSGTTTDDGSDLFSDEASEEEEKKIFGLDDDPTEQPKEEKKAKKLDRKTKKALKKRQAKKKRKKGAMGFLEVSVCFILLLLTFSTFGYISYLKVNHYPSLGLALLPILFPIALFIGFRKKGFSLDLWFKSAHFMAFPVLAILHYANLSFPNVFEYTWNGFEFELSYLWMIKIYTCFFALQVIHYFFKFDQNKYIKMVGFLMISYGLFEPFYRLAIQSPISDFGNAMDPISVFLTQWATDWIGYLTPHFYYIHICLPFLIVGFFGGSLLSIFQKEWNKWFTHLLYGCTCIFFFVFYYQAYADGKLYTLYSIIIKPFAGLIKSSVIPFFQ
jgi:hypothetical protein